MLRIRLIVVDRTRAGYLREGETLYLDRLKNYAQVEWEEVKPVKIKKGRPEPNILDLEGKALTRKVTPRDYLVALDRSGRARDSKGLAGWLERLSIEVGGWVCFVIGGPLGLSKDILTSAHEVVSLSKLTLTHEMTRLIFLEQLYRAFTIMRGEKYHK